MLVNSLEKLRRHANIDKIYIVDMEIKVGFEVNRFEGTCMKDEIISRLELLSEYVNNLRKVHAIYLEKKKFLKICDN